MEQTASDEPLSLDELGTMCVAAQTWMNFMAQGLGTLAHLLRLQEQQEHEEALAAEAKAKKGKKRAADPDAPKRPMGPFFAYKTAMIDKVKAQHPDLKFTELMKILGEQWNALSPAERGRYENEEEKERYQRESEAYRAKRMAIAEKKYAMVCVLHWS